MQQAIEVVLVFSHFEYLPGSKSMKHIGAILAALICLLCKSVFGLPETSNNNEYLFSKFLTILEYYEKLQSLTNSLSESERIKLLKKLESDSSPEALKFAGNLYYVTRI